MIYHSLYQPSRPKDCAALDFFWPSISNSCPSQPDNFFCSYQAYKNCKILELSIPSIHLNNGIFPTPSIPHFFIPSGSIHQAPSISCQFLKNTINPPNESMKDLLVVLPSSQYVSNKKKFNPSNNEHHKKHHGHAKAHISIIHS